MKSQPFPFRFGVQSRSAGPREPWLETVRRMEALGYDTIRWPDHFVRGFEPVAAMAAAAMATERLRVSGFVFDNDFRHPVVLAMSAGSIDILSNGRVELGIGAGWLKDEYDLSGIPFDPGERAHRPAGGGHPSPETPPQRRADDASPASSTASTGCRFPRRRCSNPTRR